MHIRVFRALGGSFTMVGLCMLMQDHLNLGIGLMGAGIFFVFLGMD